MRVHAGLAPFSDLHGGKEDARMRTFSDGLMWLLETGLTAALTRDLYIVRAPEETR